jgi:hypothetical protein
MALNSKYVTSSDLESLFRNKDTGEPLANGTIKFFKDTARTVPKSVYQLDNSPSYSYVDIGSVITLSAVGTVQNNAGENIILYYLPFLNESSTEQDLYFAEIYDSNGNLQFTREAWPNPVAGGGVTPPLQTSSDQDNQIANPSFTNIFLNDGANVFNFSTASNERISIAPDWEIVVSGSGSVTITRDAVDGNQKIPTSPPYELTFTIGSGITQCLLNQRMNTNSGIWASTDFSPIFLSGSFVARNTAVGDLTFEMVYAPSSGASHIIFSDQIDNNYKFHGSTSTQVPYSSDGNFGKNGYVDIYVKLPIASSFKISSINLFVSYDKPDSVLPSIDSSNRNTAYQGDYYIPRLNKKPIPSFMQAWDFSVNPFQFGLPAIPGSPDYIADQTIAQIVGGATATTARSPVVKGLSVTTSGTNSAFMLMQYLEEGDAYAVLGKRLSANIFAYTSTAGVTIPVRVYLFRAPSGTGFPLNLGTLSSDGNFSLTAGGWTQVPRSNLPQAQKTLNVSSSGDIYNESNDIGFNGWQITDPTQLNNTGQFCMVVTFGCPNSAVVNIGSISLVPGDIPCRPAPQSKAEVLEICQKYYEKSYNPNVAPGTVTYENQLMSIQTTYPNDDPTNNGKQRNMVASLFGFRYQTLKRVVPSLSIYNPRTGSNGSVQAYMSRPGVDIAEQSLVFSSFYGDQFLDRGRRAANFRGINPAFAMTVNNNMIGLEASIRYHFVADARLGKV